MFPQSLLRHTVTIIRREEAGVGVVDTVIATVPCLIQEDSRTVLQPEGPSTYQTQHLLFNAGTDVQVGDLVSPSEGVEYTIYQLQQPLSPSARTNHIVAVAW